jgi:tetratricopeptide (TPR) repeat protein
MTKTSLALMAVLAFAAAAPALADKRLDDALAKAAGQLEKDQADNALKTLQKVLSPPEAHLALARLQLQAGKLDEAGQTLDKAVELAAGGAPAVRAQALAEQSRYKLRTGTAGEALAAAEAAVQAESNAASLAAKAVAQARLLDPGALATAEKAVQADAGSAAAQAALGDALLAAHKHPEAEAAFRKALGLDARYAAASVGLSRALREQGKNSEAIAAARKATEIDPHSGEAFAELGLALLTQDPVDKSNEAIAQAQQGAFLEPKNGAVKLAVGRLFESRGQLDQAVSSYREAATLDPALASARLAALQLQYRRGDIDGALDEIKKLPPDVAQAGDVQLLYGRLLLRKEDTAGALPVLEKAAKTLSGSAEAQAILGTAYYNAGDLEKAAEAYKRASQLDPANDAYQANHGLFLGYAGKVEEGAAVLEKLASKPAYKDVGGLINLGWLYRAMKPPKVDKSVAAYKRALQLDPKSGQAALGVALAYYADKRWDEAITAFGAAKDVDKKLAGDALTGIAWSYYFKRDMDQARAYGQQAKAAGVPDVGDIDQAIVKYQEALQRGQEAAERAAAEAARRRDAEAAGGAGLGALVGQLKSGNPAQQRKAAAALCKLGREAVPHLAYALLNADLDAREVIAPCLGGMGSAAREALPILDRLVTEGPPPVNPQATRPEVERELREADLIRAMRDAAAKIRR